MLLTDLHASLLSRAFQSVLGAANEGSVAYVRCLTGEIIEALMTSPSFSPKGWKVWRVADLEETEKHTITADRAVEMRESKGDPALLLVDSARAGAGMDGIYSAAYEVKEKELFDEAIALAAHEVTVRLSRACREFAKQAVKKTRGRGRRVSVSPWTEFDFYALSAVQERHPGAFLYMLGLWPVQEAEGMDDQTALDFALLFVNHLLGSTSSSLTPAARIETLRFLDITEEQKRDLEVFLFSAATKPLLPALKDLADKPHRCA